jgi:1A family penicillin-binding protein
MSRSFERALADPSASVTTAEGLDGLPRSPSLGLRTEQRFRRASSRLTRFITEGPIGRLRRWQAALLVIAVFAMSGTAAVYFGPATLAASPPLQTAFLYDRNGSLLGVIHAEENRVVVPIAKIPTYVQDAFIAVEDGRFYSHPGIDLMAIGRAVFANARGDREGASTITQQLVKNQTVGGRRTLWRKFNEAITAIRLDRRYSKKQILEGYLNSIYLGNGAYGVEAASRTYFGHGVEEDSLAEAALLAGITAAPQRFSPRTNPKGALERRNHALNRMYESGFITAEQHQEALQKKIVVVKPRRAKVRSPLFVDWVRGEILRRFGEDTLYRGGLRVTTSLDLAVQEAAENAVDDILGRESDPAAAVVALDVETGEVRAMVGGRSPRPGDFNFATQNRRQAGSAFKPFVLAAALEDGFELSKTYRAPGSMRVRFDSGEVWKVKNYDRRGYGRLSLRSATAYSVNTVFAQLIRDVGPDRVVDVAHDLGISSYLSPVPSLALGTSGVNALEMAGAFATFARDGKYLAPTGIARARDGLDHVVYTDADREPREVISPEVAEQVRQALRGVVTRGTGRTVRTSGLYDLAGKTGTTEDHRDAWFVGFTHGYAIAVWVGYPSNKPMNHVHGIKVTGNSFPAQIFKRTLNALLERDKPESSTRSGDRPATKVEPSSAPTPMPSPSPSEEPTGEPSPEPPRRCIIICR